LDFPGVTIEAVKVVGSCKASTPNQLITYFDESHIDLNNIVENVGREETVDIKVTQRSSSQTPTWGRKSYEWFELFIAC
jgi:predicted phosphatase